MGIQMKSEETHVKKEKLNILQKFEEKHWIRQKKLREKINKGAFEISSATSEQYQKILNQVNEIIDDNESNLNAIKCEILQFDPKVSNGKLFESLWAQFQFTTQAYTESLNSQ